MAAALKKLEAEFGLPEPPELILDEKTSGYIEKLKATPDREFLGPIDVKIDDFEGPLDMLLHLVKQARVDIKDVFVSKIIDQFLSVLNQLDKIDLEKASEFISIASIFIEVKAKSLLPTNEFDKPEEDSGKRELIRKLEEYKLFKEISEKMKQQETVGLFYKPPESYTTDTIEVLKDMTPLGLLKAMQKLFSRLEKRPDVSATKQIALDRFTVADKINDIKSLLQVRNEVSFFELFDSGYSKLEIITTFQALLELLKLQLAHAEQKETYEDIIISKREPDETVVDLVNNDVLHAQKEN